MKDEQAQATGFSTRSLMNSDMVVSTLLGIVVLGPPVFGGVLGFLGARYLHLSLLLAVGLTVLGAAVTTAPLWVWYLHDSDSAAFKKWQRRHTDPVFGTPFFQWGYKHGWMSKHLEEYSGFVSIPNGGPCTKVYITPSGFTEEQRRFWLRCINDMPGLMDKFYRSIDAAFSKEFPDRGSFPHDPYFMSAQIGPDKDGILTDTVLFFEYDQDEYVNVRLIGEEVTSVEFYM